jgi:hypothetical protein
VIYQACPVRLVTDKKLAWWFIEAILLASGSHGAPLKVITQTPMMFPFRIGPLVTGDVEGHDRSELFRQGLDEEMTMLRRRGAVR